MIRRRVAAAVVVGVALVLIMAGAIALDRLESRQVDALDQRLEARVGEVVGRPVGTRGPARKPRVVELLDRARGGPGERSPFDVRGVAFVVLDDRGEQIGAVPSGTPDDPDPLPDVSGLVPDGEPSTVGSVDGGGSRFRVMATPLGSGATLVTGLSLDEVDEALDSAREILVMAGIASLFGVAAVSWFVIRRGLRPIEGMIVTAERIAEGDFTERATADDPDDEVGHLGSALNTMLDRIAAALDAKTTSEARLRRFVADASHELRTPLTSIRGYAELCRANPDEPGVTVSSLHRIEEEAKRMGVLVEDLLLLARLDQGPPLELEPVDLARLVGEAVDDARVVEPGRLIEVDLPAGDATVLGDKNRLRQVLDNLLMNVRVHTPTEAGVRVVVEAGGDDVRIVVTDEGSGMSDEQVVQAFERFWQADPTGGAKRRGSGLGLAIVADIVEAHGGEVGLSSTPGRGTTVEVLIPREVSDLLDRAP